MGGILDQETVGHSKGIWSEHSAASVERDLMIELAVGLRLIAPKKNISGKTHTPKTEFYVPSVLPLTILATKLQLNDSPTAKLSLTTYRAASFRRCWLACAVETPAFLPRIFKGRGHEPKSPCAVARHFCCSTTSTHAIELASPSANT